MLLQFSRWGHVLALFTASFTPASASAYKTYSGTRRDHAFHIVHQFPNGTWLENIRVRQDGQLLVTLLTTPDVYLIDPEASSADPNDKPTATLVHRYSSDLALLGITELERDNFYVVAGNYSGNTIQPGSFSLWSLDFRKYDAHSNTGVSAHQVAALTNAELPNGMDTLDASQNLVIIADTFAGLIWKVNVANGQKSIWMNETEFQAPSNGLGINGLKVLRRGNSNTTYVYFSNTGQMLFGRVPISPSTLQKAGPIEILSKGTAFDDFVLDPNNDAAYLAADLTDALIRISLAGKDVTTVLGGANETALIGPTSAAMENGVVYLTTDSRQAQVVAVDVGR